MTEMEILIEGLKVVGSEAKWTLLGYFFLTNLAKIVLMLIFCMSGLKAIRMILDADKK